MGCASAAAKRYAARKSGLPLVGLSRGTLRSPVPLCRPLQASGGRSEDGPAILSFKRSSFTPSPDSRHGSCGQLPRQPRRSAPHPSRQRSWHAGMLALRFPSPEEVGAWKTKLCGCRLEIGRPGCPTTGDPAAAKVMTWRKSADFQSRLESRQPWAATRWAVSISSTVARMRCCRLRGNLLTSSKINRALPDGPLPRPLLSRPRK